VEAGEAGLAGEELLHGGLFEVALLGDEPVQPAQQPIHIAQRLCNGALFGRRRKWKGNLTNQFSVEVWLAIPGSNHFPKMFGLGVDVITDEQLVAQSLVYNRGDSVIRAAGYAEKFRYS
jgi:hypothetical protein